MMSDEQPQQTPPGWYADSERPGGQRYWDGQAWTEQRQGGASGSGGIPTWLKVVGGVAGGLFVLGLIGSLFSDDDGGSDAASGTAPTEAAAPSSPEPSKVGPRFKGKLVNAEVVDPATVRVYVMVRNTGDEAATPQCKVSVSNESGSYDGWDIFYMDDPIKPGKQHGFNGVITVTNEGAAFVTDSDIDCS